MNWTRMDADYGDYVQVNNLDEDTISAAVALLRGQAELVLRRISQYPRQIVYLKGEAQNEDGKYLYVGWRTYNAAQEKAGFLHPFIFKKEVL